MQNTKTCTLNGTVDIAYLATCASQPIICKIILDFSLPPGSYHCLPAPGSYRQLDLQPRNIVLTQHGNVRRTAWNGVNIQQLVAMLYKGVTPDDDDEDWNDAASHQKY